MTTEEGPIVLEAGVGSGRESLRKKGSRVARTNLINPFRDALSSSSSSHANELASTATTTGNALNCGALQADEKPANGLHNSNKEVVIEASTNGGSGSDRRSSNSKKKKKKSSSKRKEESTNTNSNLNSNNTNGDASTIPDGIPTNGDSKSQPGSRVKKPKKPPKSEAQSSRDTSPRSSANSSRASRESSPRSSSDHLADAESPESEKAHNSGSFRTLSAMTLGRKSRRPTTEERREKLSKSKHRSLRDLKQWMQEAENGEGGLEGAAAAEGVGELPSSTPPNASPKSTATVVVNPPVVSPRAHLRTKSADAISEAKVDKSQRASKRNRASSEAPWMDPDRPVPQAVRVRSSSDEPDPPANDKVKKPKGSSIMHRFSKGTMRDKEKERKDEHTPSSSDTEKADVGDAKAKRKERRGSRILSLMGAGPSRSSRDNSLGDICEDEEASLFAQMTKRKSAEVDSPPQEENAPNEGSGSNRGSGRGERAKRRLSQLISAPKDKKPAESASDDEYGDMALLLPSTSIPATGKPVLDDSQPIPTTVGSSGAFATRKSSGAGRDFFDDASFSQPASPQLTMQVQSPSLPRGFTEKGDVITFSELYKNDPALEGLSKKERKRQDVIYELYVTEALYVKDIHLLIQSFAEPIQAKGILSRKQMSIIFSNIEAIYRVNYTLLEDLAKRRENSVVIERIGDLFIEMMDLFKLYAVYCSNQDQRVQKLAKYKMKYPALRAHLDEVFLRPECRLLELDSFLISPLQRLCKYPLLLTEILKQTEETHPDYADTVDALERMKEAVDLVNTRTKEVRNLSSLIKIQKKVAGYEGLVDRNRSVLREGELIAMATKSGKKLKIVKYQCYLMSDIFLLCQRRDADVSMFATASKRTALSHGLARFGAHASAKNMARAGSAGDVDDAQKEFECVDVMPVASMFVREIDAGKRAMFEARPSDTGSPQQEGDPGRFFEVLSINEADKKLYSFEARSKYEAGLWTKDIKKASDDKEAERVLAEKARKEKRLSDPQISPRKHDPYASAPQTLLFSRHQIPVKPLPNAPKSALDLRQAAGSSKPGSGKSSPSSRPQTPKKPLPVAPITPIGSSNLKSGTVRSKNGKGEKEDKPASAGNSPVTMKVEMPQPSDDNDFESDDVTTEPTHEDLTESSKEDEDKPKEPENDTVAVPVTTAEPIPVKDGEELTEAATGTQTTEESDTEEETAETDDNGDADPLIPLYAEMKKMATKLLAAQRRIIELENENERLQAKLQRSKDKRRGPASHRDRKRKSSKSSEKQTTP